MKKYSMYTFAVAMLAGMILTGCSSSEEIPGGTPDNGPKLKIEIRSADAAEAAYAHRAILVSEGNIADAKSAADAAALGSFSVEPGSYTVYAVASSDETNLTFTGVAASNAVADARVKITDISAQIPELLVGNSDVVTVGAEGAAAALQLKRVVASVTVTVSGLENVDAESITLTIGNMYDQVSLDGAFSKSGAAFASKSLVLTKNAEGKFVGNAIVMPTDTEASNLSLTYSVNGTDYTSTPAGRIAANGQYELATTVEAGSSSSKVNLNSAITYAAWDSTVVNLSDSFTIDETTPDKQWMGPTALPISGSAAPGYDNFWASSVFTDWDGSVKYDSYLYDGIMDGSDEHKDLYWGPDAVGEAEKGTVPSWYVDLGTGCQGITLTYWNKFGGKGGQKLRTMNIYGSNAPEDYRGGNESWTLITTFTSDRTKPTEDAGAEVTTGRIEFDKGNATYRYVKCEITSRVNADGNVVEDSDVNVAEVQITVWSCK